MNKILTFLFTLMCILIILASFFNIVLPNKVDAVAYTWGSKGVVVQYIQQKLKEWGYYEKEIDGVYGYDTWNAVKNFQNKNNILADGIVGNATLYKMGINLNNVVQVYNMKSGVYTWGSRGEMVRQIQQKLKTWGYLIGSVDGVYGYETWEAVKKFQAKNGLKVDGIVGSQTLAKIGISDQGGQTQTQETGKNVNRDTNLLAACINGEARGEPYVGMVAVGAVILNRTRDSRFPKTIAGVIYQPGAFDAVEDGQINLAPSQEAIRAAKDALNGWDPTGGSIYYWNPSTATSKWIWSRNIITVIGNHYFGK